MISSDQTRETFLKFFEDQGHKRVRSGSLVPENDPTLLFTNAGMNQFKDVFLGIEKRDYRRAASCQKCMRVSGKHNDLETVGRTARHHTFFEMLGNFSFGDYFKKEAIEFAWQLFVEVFGVASEKLYVTVFEEDDEAFNLWNRHIGLSKDRIFRLGAEDNFWAMGETGPCGPCSELHYDFGVSPLGHENCTPECPCGRFLEIWNLVFMQFNRDASGKMAPLPSPSIDTGMGLERIASVLQGVASNFDTDLFRPLISEASRLTKATYESDEKTDTSLRILADHSRACTFLIGDGVVPGNEGRGYVLRKIMRRAVRHGRMLGMEEPFIYKLASRVCDLMQDAYPELETIRDYVLKVVRYEEEKFSATLSHGLRLLDELCEEAEKKGTSLLDGTEIFKLYDTYGFPLDLAREIAQERNLDIDEKAFYREMEQQRERARASWKGSQKTVKAVYQELADRHLETEFTGYSQIGGVQGEVLALLRDDRMVESLREGESGEVVLSKTPFYAEAGGQVGDRGRMHNDEMEAVVDGARSPISGLRLHLVTVKKGELKSGDVVVSQVAPQLRASTARNHTATHLLHAALRDVLGEHVKQAGSLVSPGRLRFDFTHYRPLTSAELRGIEELVNQKIRENIEVRTEVRDLDEAVEAGAMALFGEKYSQRVRVVQVPGFSMELCGGTHVGRTGDISLFKIVSEASIAAGVRRIEAVTGEEALNRFLADEDTLDRLSQKLRFSREELAPSVERLAGELKEAKKEIEELQLKIARQQSGDVRAEAREISGIKVLCKKVEGLDRNAFRSLAGQLRDQLHSGVVVLGMPVENKVSLVAMVSSDLTGRIAANEVLARIAPLVGGRGGGRPEMAEAGGRDGSRLDEALEQAYRCVEELLSEKAM